MVVWILFLDSELGVLFCFRGIYRDYDIDLLFVFVWKRNEFNRYDG